MREPNRKSLFVEGWAFLAVAAIAFVGGLLIGDLGSSPKTETVLATSPSGGEEAEATEATGAEEGTGAATTGESAQSEEPGAQVFASEGCGSCHTFKAANSTGTTGPDLNEYLAPDDNATGIEEMIIDPNSEIAEGYTANVMPQTYGQSIPRGELERLVQFLVANSRAGGTQKEGPGGEENDVGGPTN